MFKNILKKRSSSSKNFFTGRKRVKKQKPGCSKITVDDNKKSFSSYQVVKLSLTAVYLPNWRTPGSTCPYFKIYGYDVYSNLELLYTSECANTEGLIEFTRWDPALFAVSKSTIFNKFRVEIYDKSIFGMFSDSDKILAGPIELTLKNMLSGAEIDVVGKGNKTKVFVNSFETM